MAPLTENPLFVLLYWILNTPGVGAVFVALLGGGLVLGFGLALRWISRGASAKESAVYTYPTETLHHQE